MLKRYTPAVYGISTNGAQLRLTADEVPEITMDVSISRQFADFGKIVSSGIKDGIRHDDSVDAMTYAINAFALANGIDISDRLDITKVIFNDPATIVFWTDGTKTVVKVGKDEIFDYEKGLAMAISKKFFDNKSSYYNKFKKWLPGNPPEADIVVEGTIWADNIKAGCVDKNGRFFISPLLEKAAEKDIEVKSEEEEI